MSAAFVLSQNLRRRHLSDSQKAAVAVEVLPWFEKEAKERQERTSKHAERDTGGRLRPVRANLPQPEGRARKQAAETTGAGSRNVQDAKRIKAERPEDAGAIRLCPRKEL